MSNSKQTIIQIIFKRTFVIIIFLVGIFCLDYIIGSTLSKYYFRQTDDQEASLTYTLNKCTSEILIIGNSRAQHHYIPRVFNDLLSMSCYNSGLDGGHSILLSYAILKVIKNRYTPKIVLVEFSPTTLYFDSEDYLRLSVLLPYYKSNPELKSLLWSRSNFEKEKLISQIYPFNSQLFTIVRYNLSVLSKKKDSLGFVPLNTALNNPEKIKTQFKKATIERSIDSLKLFSLHQIINYCKESNSRLIFINSPAYYQPNFTLNKDDKALLIANKIFKENGIPFWDFSTDTIFLNKPEMFADFGHLNSSGAKYFSEIIAKRLKEFN